MVKHNEPVKDIVILGAGSAGFLAALTMKRLLPGLNVTIVRSAKIPVIGVGESTTTAVPRYLHDVLGLDRGEFFREVRPSWKLGIRYEWGDPVDSHFNYTFDPCMELQFRPLGRLNAFHCLKDFSAASRYWEMMDQGKSPVVRRHDGALFCDEGPGYHIHNKPFIAYLEKKASQFGINIVTADVETAIPDEQGFVRSLQCEGGSQLTGDLFIDCSGFQSVLLSRAMNESYVDYNDSLFCTSAIVGSWQRGTDEPIMPYTTAETMDHGWCWKIEFDDHITRGYVFCPDFCTADEARLEMRTKNPKLPEDLREIKFPSGRYQRYWVKNVVAIGNASGFVEPLEATALHLMIEQLRLLRLALNDGQLCIVPALQKMMNDRYAALWNDTRDFLAVHYKFNRKLDTPFWQHCRQEVKLHDAEGLVELYQQAGPSTICDSLIPPKTIFGFNGYLSMLIGQRVPTQLEFTPTSEEATDKANHRAGVLRDVAQTLPMAEGLKAIHHPNWQWPRKGV